MVYKPQLPDCQGVSLSYAAPIHMKFVLLLLICLNLIIRPVNEPRTEEEKTFPSQHPFLDKAKVPEETYFPSTFYMPACVTSADILMSKQIKWLNQESSGMEIFSIS